MRDNPDSTDRAELSTEESSDSGETKPYSWRQTFGNARGPKLQPEMLTPEGLIVDQFIGVKGVSKGRDKSHYLLVPVLYDRDYVKTKIKRELGELFNGCSWNELSKLLSEVRKESIEGKG